jgi:hypothetical protein
MPKLNRFWKVVVGIGTFIAVIYPFAIMLMVFLPLMMMTPTLGEPIPQAFPMDDSEIGQPGFGFLFLFFPLMCIFMFSIWAVMIFYIIHLLLNEQTNKTLRVILGLGFYIMPYLAWPAYYLIYILPETPPDWALLEKPRATRKRRTS